MLTIKGRFTVYSNDSVLLERAGEDGFSMNAMHATTVIAVRKNGKGVLAADGQVSQGQTILKANANKLRTLGSGRVIAGFAGSTSDALTLFERLEKKLEECNHQLKRSCVHLAKDWRMDKYLRRLEAMMIVLDQESTLLVSGTGDVLEPEDGIVGIGSGGMYATAAARALAYHSKLDAARIARVSLEIAASICVYTNDRIITLEL